MVAVERAGAAADERLDAGGPLRDPGLRRQPHAPGLRRRPRRGVRGADGRAPVRGGRHPRDHRGHPRRDRRRAASRSPRARRAEALRGGITHLEIKSGYGLDVDDRARGCCEIAARADRRRHLPRRPRRPAEYEGRADDYVELVCGDDARRLRAAGALDRRLLRARAPSTPSSRAPCSRPARAAGLGLRVHGNQLGPGPGVRLAVEMGAASVDHCTYLDDADVEALAGGDTVATFLPATDFSTRQPYPDARRVIDAGARVAIATNSNPGSSYTTSMSFCIALAVRDMGMTHRGGAGGGDPGRRRRAAPRRRRPPRPRAPAPTRSSSMRRPTSTSSTARACRWSTRSFSRGSFATSGGFGRPRRPPRETRRAPSPVTGAFLCNTPPAPFQARRMLRRFQSE